MNKNGVPDFPDITLLSRFIAGWNVTLPGSSPSTNANISLSNKTAVPGEVVALDLNLNNIAKLNANISGYQLTVTFDRSKLDFTGYTPLIGWTSDSNGTAVTVQIIADDNNNSTVTITTDGKIGMLNFTVHGSATGTAAFSVAVAEAATGSAVTYPNGAILSGFATLTIA